MPWEPGAGEAGEWYVDPRLVSGLMSRGIEPVLLCESTGVDYAEILAGRVDTRLRLLAHQAAGLVLRWDQEPQSKGLNAPWFHHANYIDVFEYVSGVMRAEADVRLAYCSTSDVDSIEGFYSGDACQVVGFDVFSRKEGGRFPPQQWAGPIAEFERIAPGKPIWVFESGRLVHLSKRAAWLKSIASVQGLDVACLWDMDVPGHPDDFTWSGKMAAAFAGMMA